jgi:hypothetical protein
VDDRDTRSVEPAGSRESPLGIRLAWLGLASAAADLGSVYLKAPAAPRGVTWGDGIEIAGAYVVLALYTSIAFALVRARERSSAASIPALPLALLFVAFVSFALGRGIHVAANSIHDLLDPATADGALGLAYFWDERAGHLPVDAARILFAVSLCALEVRDQRSRSAAAPASLPRMEVFPFLGAVAYGFIYFATSVEGQTVALALLFSTALAFWGLRQRREAGSAGPVAAFFTTAALVSLLFFLFYGIWQRGFPEFTRAGIL